MTSADPTPRQPIEHRPPSETTVKRLYATALGCCKPGCGEELFRLNQATGAYLLNSRVAHIHARREGGPRWDPQMSEDANRSYENLLLLCISHASEIDDTPEHYPPEVLHSWKQAELDNYLHHQRNWTLSDVQAAEVAAASFDLQPALDEILTTLPYSARMRSRDDALAHAVARARAKRSVRLGALVPEDQVDAVVNWMEGNSDPVIEVPEGQIRVLVAPMGAGKSEQALRWLEEALSAARHDTGVEIPIWLDARQIIGGLEASITAVIGAEPLKTCRVVIDDLDSMAPKDADYLLNDARELVRVWPRLSVLATSRPGPTVGEAELLKVDPWSAERGTGLLRLLVGERVPWGLWTHETERLLESPLTVLALAAWINAGGDPRVSRLQLLSDLAGTIVNSRYAAQATDETWHELARLAARALTGAGQVRAASFSTEPRIGRLTATGLVVNEGGFLTFALPLFEQHFGAQALAGNVVTLESAASPAAFPRWRYAIAFEISSSEPPDQEQLMIRLARVNPAAALWVLGEITPGQAYTGRCKNPSDSAVVGMIGRWRGSGEAVEGRSSESSPAILAASWLREAERALLDGVGPLAESLATHHEGQLVQWGAWLQSGYLTVAEASRTLPPPEVVELDRIHPEIIVSGWQRWTQFAYPDADLGRWLWTQDRLRQRLQLLFRQRTLPVPRTSRLARERLWFLGRFVMKFGASRPLDIIEAAPLRAKVAEWMERVENSVNSRWQNGAITIESADVRWLHAQLELETADVLEPPWPAPDWPHAAGRWAWQCYSPELTLTIATQVLQDALAGYRDLVDLNFPRFGAALGLYSILPIRIEGIVGRPVGDIDRPQVEMMVEFIGDPSPDSRHRLVSLQLVTDRADRSLYEFERARRRDRLSTFSPRTVEATPLGLHVPRPATNLAYEWLARDLKAIGWLSEDFRYHD